MNNENGSLGFGMGSSIFYIRRKLRLQLPPLFSSESFPPLLLGILTLIKTSGSRSHELPVCIYSYHGLIRVKVFLGTKWRVVCAGVDLIWSEIEINVPVQKGGLKIEMEGKQTIIKSMCHIVFICQSPLHTTPKDSYISYILPFDSCFLFPRMKGKGKSIVQSSARIVTSEWLFYSIQAANIHTWTLLLIVPQWMSQSNK